MRRISLALVAAVAAARCGPCGPVPGSTCNSDTDCLPGNVCNLQFHLCESVSPDSGQDAGNVGGQHDAGNGTDAGVPDASTGDAGFNDSGATDAGPQCPPNCGALQFSMTLPPPPARDGGRGNCSQLLTGDPTPGFDLAYPKGAILDLAVTSTSPFVSPSTVNLTVFAADGGPVLQLPIASSSGCGQRYCGTAQLDLAQVPLPALQGLFSIVISGEDTGGNAASVDAGIAITRVAWGAALFRSVAGSPAIGDGGIVYLAMQSPPGVVALSASGNEVWCTSATGSNSRIAVGPSGTVYSSNSAFVVGSSASGSLSSFDGMTGDAGASCTVSPNECLVNPAIGFTQFTGDSTPVETAYAVCTGNDGGELVALRPSSGQSCLTAATQRPPVAGPTGATALVTDGTALFWVDSVGELNSANLVNGIWQARTGFPVSIGSSNGRLINGTDVANAVDSASHAVVSVPRRGGAPDFLSTSAAQSYWLTAMNLSSLVYTTTDGFLNVLTLPSQLSQSPIANTDVASSPVVLGEGETVYWADSSGGSPAHALYVFTSAPTELWEAGGLGNLEFGIRAGILFPTLDCERDATGKPQAGRPGVLYAAGMDTTGVRVALYSIIVDSKGVDVGAPWPLVFHDPANSANAVRDLSEFACP